MILVYAAETSSGRALFDEHASWALCLASGLHPCGAALAPLQVHRIASPPSI